MGEKGTKIAILGAGVVGATIAYTLTVEGMASEIALIDINQDKAKGEAMDIAQGAASCAPVSIYAGDYQDAAGAKLVIVTVGLARKPGQTRIELAQVNVGIINDVIPKVVRYAPDAIYVVVSNPVDVLTHAIIKTGILPERQVIGSGTILDTLRLRAILAERMGVNPVNVHAYVLGEHGDTSMIPWSLSNIGGIDLDAYCKHVCGKHGRLRMFGGVERDRVAEEVRTSGAKVIDYKGSTSYAIALAVRHICKSLLRPTNTVVTVSNMLHGEYGIEDVCLSVPYVISPGGIEYSVTPPLPSHEEEALRASAGALKKVLAFIGM